MHSLLSFVRSRSVIHFYIVRNKNSIDKFATEQFVKAD